MFHDRLIRYSLTIVGLLIVAGCVDSETNGIFSSDYRSTDILSPSGTYKIFATVNRTSADGEYYARVVLHLTNSSGDTLDSVRSGVGDFNKWAIGWMLHDDIVVVYSVDIGTTAYTIKEYRLVRLTSVGVEIRERADELYEMEYGNRPFN